MQLRVAITLFLALLLAAGSMQASSTSYTGTLAGPTDVYQLDFSLASPATIALQTWGFGGTKGGTNAAGNVIAPGGFDPLVAFWSGSGSGATLIDGSADVLLNYGSYVGCPPAGTVAFANGDDVCGDLTLQFSLAPGNYIVTLSDAAYQPNALTCCGTTLGDGFSDLTGGVFQTCDFNLSTGSQTCITPTANWAFDLNIGTTSTVPEPASLALVAGGLALGILRRRGKATRLSVEEPKQ